MWQSSTNGHDMTISDGGDAAAAGKARRKGVFFFLPPRRWGNVKVRPQPRNYHRLMHASTGHSVLHCDLLADSRQYEDGAGSVLLHLFVVGEQGCHEVRDSCRNITYTPPPRLLLVFSRELEAGPSPVDSTVVVRMMTCKAGHR